MKIFVINAGSSSLKYQVIDMTNETLLVKGNVERIGIVGTFIKQKRADGKTYEIQKNLENHSDARARSSAAVGCLTILFLMPHINTVSPSVELGFSSVSFSITGRGIGKSGISLLSMFILTFEEKYNSLLKDKAIRFKRIFLFPQVCHILERVFFIIVAT